MLEEEFVAVVDYSLGRNVVLGLEVADCCPEGNDGENWEEEEK